MKKKHSKQDLAPCPFCGSTSITKSDTKNLNGDRGLQCRDCGATAESKEQWNLRHWRQEAFITCESDGAASDYRVVLKFRTLKQAQACHLELIGVPQ